MPENHHASTWLWTSAWRSNPPLESTLSLSESQKVPGLTDIEEARARRKNSTSSARIGSAAMATKDTKAETGGGDETRSRRSRSRERGFVTCCLKLLGSIFQAVLKVKCRSIMPDMILDPSDLGLRCYWTRLEVINSNRYSRPSNQ